jgi:hypothetical protein
VSWPKDAWKIILTTALTTAVTLAVSGLFKWWQTPPDRPYLAFSAATINFVEVPQANLPEPNNRLTAAQFLNDYQGRLDVTLHAMNKGHQPARLQAGTIRWRIGDDPYPAPDNSNKPYVILLPDQPGAEFGQVHGPNGLARRMFFRGEKLNIYFAFHYTPSGSTSPVYTCAGNLRADVDAVQIGQSRVAVLSEDCR